MVHIVARIALVAAAAAAQDANVLEEPIMCCQALTPECLACSKGVTVEELCEKVDCTDLTHWEEKGHHQHGMHHHDGMRDHKKGRDEEGGDFLECEDEDCDMKEFLHSKKKFVIGAAALILLLTMCCVGVCVRRRCRKASTPAENAVLGGAVVFEVQGTVVVDAASPAEGEVTTKLDASAPGTTVVTGVLLPAAKSSSVPMPAPQGMGAYEQV